MLTTKVPVADFDVYKDKIDFVSVYTCLNFCEVTFAGHIFSRHFNLPWRKKNLQLTRKDILFRNSIKMRRNFNVR